MKQYGNYAIVVVFALAGPVFLKHRASILFACVYACGAAPHALAQGPCPPIAPRQPAPPPSGDEDKVEITAGHVELGAAEGAEFSDHVEFRYGDRSLSADRAQFRRSEQQLEVTGTVTYRAPDVAVYGEDAKVDAETEEVTFSKAGFDLPERPARGSATEVTIRSDNTLSLSSVNFTTCPAEQVDWELLASKITFDIDRGFGTARAVKLRFKGVPILYAPYMTFPIDDRRKSGFLTPHLGKSDRTGLDISAPYYLNLAPNYDMTLEPRYLSKRGLQLNTEARYLLPSSGGQLNFDYLPDDRQTDSTRRYINFQHHSVWSGGWSLVTGIEEVSDDAYFEDLGGSLSVTSQTHLNRYVDATYFAPNWSILTRLQDYQTIDALLQDQDKPYERVPQTVFSGRWLGHKLRFDSATELVNFDRNVGVTGWRLDSTQEVSMRFSRGGMFLTPSLALRQTNYWLNNAPGANDSPSRTLPVASLDAGLRFERPIDNARGWTQTLEPRLLYVYVPYKDQSMLPVFDTIEPDLNLVQLFRKYQYVGPDRIADADKMSFGVTTRLIDSQTGQQRLAATLGQTRYLTNQRVSLPGQAPNTANASDYLAELSLNLFRTWNVDIGYQWNSDTNSTARAETRFQYQPKEDRLFGFGYRYRPGLLEQGDVSLVWPAASHWRVIGRYSYSFLDNKPLEQFLGWEYNACCWRLRLVGRHYISRRTGESDSSLLLQLELKGLSQPSSAAELLDRGILGYPRTRNAL